MTIAENVCYQRSHEWVRRENDEVVVGISDYAQDELGDVVYVQLPEAGTTLKRGESFGVVESVKAASDLYMPADGEIIAVNEALEDAPELVNGDPYGDGWMIRFRVDDANQLDDLLDSGAYRTYTESLETQ